MDQGTREYLERRAREERERAKASVTPRAARIHLELAKLYDGKLNQLAGAELA